MADRTFVEPRNRLGEWFLRRATLRAATARLPQPGEPAERAFQQARLLREIVKQVAEPIERLSSGNGPAARLALYRDLVYWTLIAARNGGHEGASDLRTAWDRAPGDRLLRAAGGVEALEMVRAVLVNLSGVDVLDVTDADVARVATFAESLYAEVEAPRRRVHRIVGQRWLRMGAAGAAVLAIALTARWIAIGPDLAAKATVHTSSTLDGCATDPGCAQQLFHTNSEENPWIEFDLGAPKPVRNIRVQNRMDCCQERSIPLVIEFSDDHRSWKQVARRDEDFTTWTATFPRLRARYVRLRVPRSTIFHLRGVEIR